MGVRGARRVAESGKTLLVVGLAILATHALALTLFALPGLVIHRRALIALPLGAAVMLGVWGGRAPALVASLPMAAYTVGFFVAFGTAPQMVSRLSLGVAMGLFGAVATVLVGHLRERGVELLERTIEQERVRREEAERANRELAAVNAGLTDFTHVVAHDLRNPVRGLHALLEHLEGSLAPRAAEEERQDLALAKATALRLDGLLESLLEYSRVTRFDPSDLEAARVGEVAGSDLCRSRYEALARERGARIEVEAHGVVHANRGALALVLGNLVANAIRHNPKPQPRVRVSTRPASSPPHVEVFVDDNGPGFSPEARARLDEALAGRLGSHDAGSLGFGLLMVARAVERLGGALRIEESPLGGARVRIHLPGPP